MGQNLTKTRANWQRRLQTVLGITLIFGLFGCFAPEEGPINVIELEPGKPEWASDARKRVMGHEVSSPISYSEYGKIYSFRTHNVIKNFSDYYVDTELRRKIKQNTNNPKHLFDNLLKEGMRCTENYCFRHYCTWQSYIKDGVHKRETPRYCIDLAIKPVACFPQSSDCVNVTNFTVSE